MSYIIREEDKGMKIKAELLGINEVQRLHLRLIELASFNSFNGQKVVKDLLNHIDWWEACLMDRLTGRIRFRKGGPSFSPVDNIDLIKLRDIPINSNNVDRIWIIPNKEKEDNLQALAETWKADLVQWIEPKDAGLLMGGFLKERTRLLTCWWD